MQTCTVGRAYLQVKSLYGSKTIEYYRGLTQIHVIFS